MRRLISERGRAVCLFASARSQVEFLDDLVNAEGVEWTKVIGFHSDERLGVGEESPQSQRRFLIERLVKRVPMAEFHGLRGEAANPEAVCANYAALLKSRPPDLAALDLGENGRLASIYPRVCDFNDPLMVRVVEGDEASLGGDEISLEGDGTSREGDGTSREGDEASRGAISLTVPAIMACPKLILIATDPEAFRQTIEGEITTACPASILRTHEDAHIFTSRL